MTSSFFKTALADTVATFQNEIQVQHDACVSSLHNENLQLRAKLIACGTNVSGNGFSSQESLKLQWPASPSDRTNGTPKRRRSLPTLADTVEALSRQTSPCVLEPHPCQILGQPVAPPPAPLPCGPLFPTTPAGGEFISDVQEKMSGLFHQPSHDQAFSPRLRCFTDGTVLTGATSIRSCLTRTKSSERGARPSGNSAETMPGSDKSEYALISRWEHMVFEYVFSDAFGRPREEEEWVWEIQPVWLHKDYRRAVSRISVSKEFTNIHSMTNHVQNVRTGDRMLSEGWLQLLVMEPCSDKRMVWALLSAVMVLYDMIMIPMGSFVAWESPVLASIGLVTMVYWLMDLVLTFFIGFLDNGIMEMRPLKVALHYIKTWFALDFLLVSIDVFYYIVENSKTTTTGAVRLPKAARMGRILRFVRGIRLFRLMKLSDTFSHIIDVQSEYKLLTMKLILHLCVILAINHYVACGWFTLGLELQRESIGQCPHSWIVVAGIEDAEPYFQYFVSLHWSITQFTPATNNINPTCALERAYAILVVLFALVAFSSFVSSVTNTVNEIRRINMERINEEAKIREFISERCISQDIAMRIWYFFRLNYVRRRRVVVESDIRFFLGVPQGLIANMREEMYMPVLRAHAALNTLKNLDRIMTRRICHTCFSDLYAYPKQDIFLHHMECHRVFFIRMGNLVYRSGCSNRMANSFCSTLSTISTPSAAGSADPEGSQSVSFLQVSDAALRSSKARWTLMRLAHGRRASKQDWEARCQAGRWVSEAALWVTWRHCGQLSTETSADIIALDCGKFHGIFSEIDGPLWQALKGVAVFFAEYAENEMQGGRIVTDISVEHGLMDTLANRSLTFQVQRQGLLRGTSFEKSVFYSGDKDDAAKAADADYSNTNKHKSKNASTSTVRKKT